MDNKKVNSDSYKMEYYAPPAEEYYIASGSVYYNGKVYKLKKYITTSSYNENYGWWNDSDFGKDTEKDKKEECEHKWKRVQGINRYYIVCEHCDERDKEAEEKQWEDK